MKIHSLDWAFSSTAVAVILAILCIILLVCSLPLLKLCYVGRNRDSSKQSLITNVNYWIFMIPLAENAEKEIEMRQNEVYGILT